MVDHSARVEATIRSEYVFQSVSRDVALFLDWLPANLHDHRLRFAIYDVAQSTIVALGLVHLPGA